MNPYVERLSQRPEAPRKALLTTDPRHPYNILLGALQRDYHFNGIVANPIPDQPGYQEIAAVTPDGISVLHTIGMASGVDLNFIYARRAYSGDMRIPDEKKYKPLRDFAHEQHTIRQNPPSPDTPQTVTPAEEGFYDYVKDWLSDQVKKEGPLKHLLTPSDAK